MDRPVTKALPGSEGRGRPALGGALVTLRLTEDGDVVTLLAILDEPEVGRWWRRTEWERVDEKDAVVFSIVLYGAVVGCIQYAEETDPDYRSAAVDVFVSSAVRGRGVGSDAMRTLIAWLIDVRGTIALPSTRRSPTHAPSTSTRNSAFVPWACCGGTNASRTARGATRSSWN